MHCELDLWYFYCRHLDVELFFCVPSQLANQTKCVHVILASKPWCRVIQLRLHLTIDPVQLLADVKHLLGNSLLLLGCKLSSKFDVESIWVPKHDGLFVS